MLYTFAPNKSYTYLLNIKPSNLVFLKLITEFRGIIITFSDQNGRPLKINLTLLINRNDAIFHRTKNKKIC